MCSENGIKKPRMYRKNARRDYLNYAKKRKSSGKSTRKAISKQLSYVKRDLGYIEKMVENGAEISLKHKERV